MSMLISRTFHIRALASLLVLGLALLAGCAETEAVKQSRTWRAQIVLTSPEADALQVTIVDLSESERIDEIVLAGPQGQRVQPVDTVERNRIVGGDSIARPSIGVGVFGGSSGHVSSGVGISVPIFSKRDSVRGEKQVREIVARIPILDRESYRAEPESWRVEITATDVAGQTRTRTFPVPEPG